VNLILTPVGDQFHPYQCFEVGNLKIDGSFGFVDIRQSVFVVPPNFLASIEEVNGFAWTTLWAIYEHIDVENIVEYKPGRFECGSNGGQVGARYQEIDVACRADGSFVFPGDPLGDGISTNDGVGYAGRIESAGCPAQALFDFFRCHERPFPTADFDYRICHDEHFQLRPLVSLRSTTSQ